MMAVVVLIVLNLGMLPSTAAERDSGSSGTDAAGAEARSPRACGEPTTSASTTIAETTTTPRKPA